MSDSYNKILDTIIILGYTQERFQPYSANDIKKLIASKMSSVREPKDLRCLYRLESMITDLRLSLEKEKANKIDETPRPVLSTQGIDGEAPSQEVRQGEGEAGS